MRSWRLVERSSRDQPGATSSSAVVGVKLPSVGYDENACNTSGAARETAQTMASRGCEVNSHDALPGKRDNS